MLVCARRPGGFPSAGQSTNAGGVAGRRAPLLLFAVAIFAYLVMDGETNWYEGIQLLAVYAIIAVALYFLPATAMPVHG